MIDDTARYRQGYSIGVGGVVLSGERVLLVRLGYGRHRDQWAIPGGYVELEETIDVAIQREVLEETGISAEVEGLIAARSRLNPNDNSAYLIFLLRAKSEEPRADGVEVLDARLFSLDEVRALPDVTPLSRILVTQALESPLCLLKRTPVPTYAPGEIALFM
jgi:ADP-ribose pyrophosphatase YjhB (NUDIX family)